MAAWRNSPVASVQPPLWILSSGMLLKQHTHVLSVGRGQAGRQERSLLRGSAEQSLCGYSTWQRYAVRLRGALGIENEDSEEWNTSTFSRAYRCEAGTRMPCQKSAI